MKFVLLLTMNACSFRERKSRRNAKVERIQTWKEKRIEVHGDGDCSAVQMEACTFRAGRYTPTRAGPRVG